MTSIDDFATCPCGVGAAYANHCKKHHDVGFAGLSATAEDTMRARYSAYVVGNTEFLLATWHDSTRPEKIDFSESIQWHGLTVEEIENGTGLATTGTVEFRAKFQRGDAHLELHERSSFLRDGGRWYFVEGFDPDAPDRQD